MLELRAQEMEEEKYMPTETPLEDIQDIKI